METYKVGLFLEDTEYMLRFCRYFNESEEYAIQFCPIDSQEDLVHTLEEEELHLLLLSDVFAKEAVSSLLEIEISYISEEKEACSAANYIYKYQKMDDIYEKVKERLERLDDSTEILGADEAKILGFISVSGGMGTSTAARAAALYFRKKGCRVLYLSFEGVESLPPLKAEESGVQMADLLAAFRNEDTDFDEKLQAACRQSGEGIWFYGNQKLSLERNLLSEEEGAAFVQAVCAAREVDYIVVDLGSDLNAVTYGIMKRAAHMILVHVGSPEANRKLARVLEVSTGLEEKAGAALKDKSCLLYNKYEEGVSQFVRNIDIRLLGGAADFKGGQPEHVIDKMSQMGMFEQLG